MGKQAESVSPAGRLRDAWRQSRWRHGLPRDLAATVAIALAATAIGLLAVPRLLDGLFFDAATRIEPGRAPRVMIIDLDRSYLQSFDKTTDVLPPAAAALGIGRLCYRTPHTPEAEGGPARVIAHRVAQVPASDRWRFDPSPVADRAGATLAATVMAAPDYGVQRAQLYGLAAGAAPIPLFETACAGRPARSGSYLVRMPAGQNIPRIAASQLTSGAFKGRELAGMVAIVAPDDTAGRGWLATPLNPDARAISPAVFSAYAVQSLLDGREVRRAALWLAALAVLLSCLAAMALMRTPAMRRFAPATLLGGSVALPAAAWVVLYFANLLLPMTAMVGGFLVAGLSQIRRQARAQERRLARTLEQAINLSFSRSVFYDQARTADYLATLARLLKLPRMVVLQRGEGGRWKGVAAHGATPGDIALDTSGARQALAAARLANEPVAAGALAPDWGEGAQLAILSEGDADLAWVYTLPATRLAPHSARVARSLTQSLRQMRQWQHQLLGGAVGNAATATIDARVAGAARLITVQSEQIREGLDALDTAVLIFHPAGFAIQANSRMAALCSQIGLQLETATIGEAIGALTGVTTAQSDSIVQKMLLRGGEMRVPMRDIASRQYVLRVGASHEREEQWQRVIVLEAVDVSELDQLAELRLSVGTFIDRQLRNDLEAISLGATLALDPRMDATALARVVGRIRDVTARATGRLEQVSELLSEKPVGPPSPSYPIEARKSVLQALERVESFAAELSVTIDSRLPAISGFTLAEPLMLTDTVEAILRLVIADTAQNGTVTLELDEGDERTEIRVAGGFGMPFDRLCEALDARPGEVPVEYQIAAAGFAEALAWQGSVSYWSAAGNGYRFNIRLRRIG